MKSRTDIKLRSLFIDARAAWVISSTLVSIDFPSCSVDNSISCVITVLMEPSLSGGFVMEALGLKACPTKIMRAWARRLNIEEDDEE